jgi:hypothetical protein
VNGLGIKPRRKNFNGVRQLEFFFYEIAQVMKKPFRRFAVGMELAMNEKRFYLGQIGRFKIKF